MVCLAIAVQVGCNFSDQSNLVSVDAERGAYKFGYDFQKEVSSRTGRRQYNQPVAYHDSLGLAHFNCKPMPGQCRGNSTV